MEKLKSSNATSLEKEYGRLKEHHKEAIRTRLARLTIGSSVGRVLKKGSKEQIWHILEKVPVDDIIQLQSEQNYKEWFEEQLDVLAQVTQLR